MNKTNKRLIISAAIVLVLGFATLIPSIFTTIPYVQQVLTKTENQHEQKLITTQAGPITGVVIDAYNANIRLEASETEEVQVKVENSLIESIEVATTVENQQLKIEAQTLFTLPKFSLDANQFIEETVGILFNDKVATVIIQVPKTQALNVEIKNASDVTVVDSELLGAKTLIDHSGAFRITNPVLPTTPKQLIYSNNYNYYTNIDYKTLNAFSDVTLRGDYITLQNQFYTEALTTQTLVVEANSIEYQYIPFTGTITLRDTSWLDLQFNTIPNIDWQIQTNNFQILDNEGNTLAYGNPWQFQGYFWPTAEKATGKMIIESSYTSIYSQQVNQAIGDFVENQPGLEVVNYITGY